MIKQSPFLLIAVLVAMTTTTTAYAADNFHKMSANEIRSKIAGMEITDEVHWAELYNRDGTYTMWSMAKKFTGKWLVKDGALCLDGGREAPNCKEVWISGNKIEFRQPGGIVFEGVLKKQEPRT